MIKPPGAFSLLNTWILRQVKTSNTTLIPDELALLLSSSFSFNQQFSCFGISCRVLLTVSFPTRLFSSSQCLHANFQMSSVTSPPSPAIWEPHRQFFLLSSSWDLLLFKGICLQAPYYADSFFLSHCLLFLLSSFYVYWVSFLPFCLLFLVCPSQLEDAQIHLDTVSVPQMFSLGNAVGIHLLNNFSKCFWNETRTWRHIFIQGIILKSDNRWRFAKTAVTMIT